MYQIVVLTLGSLFLFSLFYFFFFLYPKRKKEEGELSSRVSSLLATEPLKEYWYWLTYPLFYLLQKTPPNTISFLSFGAGVLSSYSIYQGKIALGGWLLALSGTLDTLDGRVARAGKKVSSRGAFLDSILDRGVDFLIGASFYMWIRNFYPSLEKVALGVFFLFLFASYLLSYSKERGANLGYKDVQGFMQRADRVFFLSLFAILNPIFSLPYPLFFLGFLFVGGLLFLSSLARIFRIYKNL